MPPLSLTLLHPDPAMCEAFSHRFANLPNIQVLQARFEQLPPHDCFVTAGNAFGLMSAGIDAAVIHRLGTPLMHRVQQHIHTHFLGEQPVGTCFLLDTRNSDFPVLAHAPTMRVPGSIAGTDKVYAATWAALLAIHHHNQSAPTPIRTVALPAMGTGFGNVPFTEAARQMAAAYRHYLHPPKSLDWELVASRQKAIAYDGPRPMLR